MKRNINNNLIMETLDTIRQLKMLNEKLTNIFIIPNYSSGDIINKLMYDHHELVGKVSRLVNNEDMDQELQNLSKEETDRFMEELLNIKNTLDKNCMLVAELGRDNY